MAASACRVTRCCPGASARAGGVNACPQANVTAACFTCQNQPSAQQWSGMQFVATQAGWVGRVVVGEGRAALLSPTWPAVAPGCGSCPPMSRPLPMLQAGVPFAQSPQLSYFQGQCKANPNQLQVGPQAGAAPGFDAGAAGAPGAALATHTGTHWPRPPLVLHSVCRTASPPRCL